MTRSTIKFFVVFGVFSCAHYALLWAGIRVPIWVLFIAGFTIGILSNFPIEEE